jgi:hypothetical protein
MYDLKFVDSQWIEHHINCIENYYRNSKYFGECFPIIKQIISAAKHHQHLSEYNKKSTEIMLRFLNIERGLVNGVMLNAQMEDKTDTIIKLIQAVSGDSYLSGTGAMVFQDKSKFVRNTIRFFLQNTSRFDKYSIVHSLLTKGREWVLNQLKDNEQPTEV